MQSTKGVLTKLQLSNRYAEGYLLIGKRKVINLVDAAFRKTNPRYIGDSRFYHPCDRSFAGRQHANTMLDDATAVRVSIQKVVFFAMVAVPLRTKLNHWRRAHALSAQHL